MNYRMLLRIVPVLFSSLLFAGCAGSSGISTDRSDRFVYATIGGVNHTDMYMDWFSIDGHGGANVDAYGITSGVCCVGVPRVYRPGLTVNVEWQARDKNDKPIRKSKVVEVEPYTEAGTIYAHIFPNDVVRVVVAARYGPGNPNHPIPLTVNPNRKQGPQQ